MRTYIRRANGDCWSGEEWINLDSVIGARDACDFETYDAAQGCLNAALEGDDAGQFDDAMIVTVDDAGGEHPTPETICQQFAGSNYNSREYKRVAAAIDWNQVWPEIDRHGNLTGRLVGDEGGFFNVDDEAMISRDEARAGRWRIADGHASEPEPAAVEFAVADETIRMRAADEVIGLEHPAMQDACAAYRTAAINALRVDPRAARLEDCPPRGQRILHSQWCGAHWGYSSGAIGTMATDLTEQEKDAISAADDAGREAARKVIAAAEEPTRAQIAALQDEAAAAGDDAMASICAAALDGDPVALAAAAQCISDAAAQRDE